MNSRTSDGKLNGISEISDAFSFDSLISSNIAWSPSDILVGDSANSSNKIEKVSCKGFSMPNSVLIKFVDW